MKETIPKNTKIDKTIGTWVSNVGGCTSIIIDSTPKRQDKWSALSIDYFSDFSVFVPQTL